MEKENIDQKKSIWQKLLNLFKRLLKKLFGIKEKENLLKEDLQKDINLEKEDSLEGKSKKEIIEELRQLISGETTLEECFTFYEKSPSIVLSNVIYQASCYKKYTDICIYILKKIENLDNIKIEKRALDDFLKQYLRDSVTMDSHTGYNYTCRIKMEDLREIIVLLANKGADLGDHLAYMLGYNFKVIGGHIVNPVRAKQDIAKVLLENAKNWPIEKAKIEDVSEMINMVYNIDNGESLKEILKLDEKSRTTQKIICLDEAFRQFAKNKKKEIEQLSDLNKKTECRSKYNEIVKVMKENFQFEINTLIVNEFLNKKNVRKNLNK